MQVVCPNCSAVLNHNDRVKKDEDLFICPECKTEFKCTEEKE